MFDFLLNKSNIGVYNKCEIIEIFGMKKDSEIPFNIFTLVIFQNTQQENIKEFLFDKLQKFQSKKDITWGIQRRIVDISIVEKLYDDLLNKKIFQIDKPLKIGFLKLLPEQYIQPEDNFNRPQLNDILKNNFKYGSYILEFFDEDKSNCQFLLDEPEVLNSFSENLSDKLPIRIGNLSDRLGNVIFQFPINSFSMTWTTKKNKELNRYEGLKFEIEAKNSNFDISNLIIQIYEENDNTITRQRLVEVKEAITEISLDDCFGTTIEVFDKKSSLLLYKHKFSIIKNIYSTISSSGLQARVFCINKEEKRVPISNGQSNNKNVINRSEYVHWIGNRKYKQELKELEEKKSFIQYYEKEEDKALSDVRELIKKYGENGVYLWDPYLSADDIKKTLYYSSNAYVPLRAITNLSQGSKKIEEIFKKVSFSNVSIDTSFILIDFQHKLNQFTKLSKKQQAKQEMIEKFNEDDNQFLFLDLEVRGKIGSNGYGFHDRFLIFPLETPKVWSLGISVNSLGKSHHILQEVKHAQYILNAFNDLWEKLDKEECLVWKSR